MKNILIKLLFYCIKIFGKKCHALNFKRVLVIAPHPDDEILGFGGTLLNLIESGAKIYIIYLTDGENSGVWPDKEEIRIRRILLSQQVCKSLRIETINVTRLHLPDGAVPISDGNAFNEVVKSIKEIISTFRPEAVFATHPLDYWPFDHVACAKLAYSAVMKSEYKCQLWYYWVWAWYNIKPWNISINKMTRLYMSDVRNQLASKKNLIRDYLEEFTADNQPWSGNLPQSLLKALSNDYEILENCYQVYSV